MADEKDRRYQAVVQSLLDQLSLKALQTANLEASLKMKEEDFQEVIEVLLQANDQLPPEQRSSGTVLDVAGTLLTVVTNLGKEGEA